MNQWHCSAGGKQYGPVDEPTLKAWIAEGRLKPTDLIWREGMAEWQPISSFPEFSGAAGGVPPVSPDAGRFVPPPTGGTNGTTPVLEITASAHAALKGRWGQPMGFCVLLWLINTVISMIPNVGNLISLFVTGAFTFGISVYFLTLIRGGQTQLGNMFDGFHVYGKTLGLYLFMSLLIFLWLLLLIIPGIIASLAYSQAFFLLVDHPDLRVTDAVRRSKEMMKGHKWRLFCMQLWFALLSILCIFTLFIGFLWLVPYMYASLAKFYEDLQPPLNPAT